jgi:hypothetical protein
MFRPNTQNASLKWVFHGAPTAPAKKLFDTSKPFYQSIRIR